MEKIKVDEIKSDFQNAYHPELLKFSLENNIKLPRIKSGNGLALSVMSHNKNKYWTREDTEEFVKKYNILTADSIQLFNKHEQKGIKCIRIKGKNMLVYPYELSNKYIMRKNFKFEGTEEQRKIEIEKIKSTIRNDYIDVPNSEWQLGHKNPESTDNSSKNLILQPPIQSKYRDNYIFIDTLTKIPTPLKFISDHKSGNLPYTDEQIKQLKDYLNSLTTS